MSDSHEEFDEYESLIFLWYWFKDKAYIDIPGDSYDSLIAYIFDTLLSSLTTMWSMHSEKIMTVKETINMESVLGMNVSFPDVALTSVSYDAKFMNLLPSDI